MGFTIKNNATYKSEDILKEYYEIVERIRKFPISSVAKEEIIMELKNHLDTALATMTRIYEETK